ncbi:nuclear transport factor 2 family protein [Klenkia taihuensis]|uniref:nuclear transport factor 2 family protein n=1 Tax=Klenkia taihuensis TaxID=1225127 RepID=UPI001A96D28C|nr:nuclear transport factor 2 family protein [Klenkia taihuensis]
MKKSFVVGVVAVGMLGISGCGSTSNESSAMPPSASVSPSTSSASPDTSSAATSNEPAQGELRAAVQSYSDAFLTGDADVAYDLLTARCKDRTSAAQFSGIVSAASQLYGAALPITSYSAEVSEDLARVTYTYDVPAINQTSEPWAREDGEWKQDDC